MEERDRAPLSPFHIVTRMVFTRANFSGNAEALTLPQPVSVLAGRPPI